MEPIIIALVGDRRDGSSQAGRHCGQSDARSRRGENTHDHDPDREFHARRRGSAWPCSKQCSARWQRDGLADACRWNGREADRACD
jgi:hypothetical protein